MKIGVLALHQQRFCMRYGYAQMSSVKASTFADVCAVIDMCLLSCSVCAVTHAPMAQADLDSLLPVHRDVVVTWQQTDSFLITPRAWYVDSEYERLQYVLQDTIFRTMESIIDTTRIARIDLTGRYTVSAISPAHHMC